MGRICLHIALDCSAYSLETFIICNIEPGATIVSDSWRSYQFIDKEQYRHEITNQSKATTRENLYGVHLVTSLVKRLIRGTYHGRFEPKYLQQTPRPKLLAPHSPRIVEGQHSQAEEARDQLKTQSVAQGGHSNEAP